VHTTPNIQPQALAALPPGGAFIALDLIIDDARRRNRWGLYMSLSMLTEFECECAFDYSHADFREWAAQVGFERTEAIHLGGPASAVVAYKGMGGGGAGGGNRSNLGAGM
jgi:hypothetical protein